MSELPHAADMHYSDPDTLGAIPAVMTATYCEHCGRSQQKVSHGQCEREHGGEAPTYCTSCRRELEVTVEGDRWTAVCKKHGESTGTLGR